MDHLVKALLKESKFKNYGNMIAIEDGSSEMNIVIDGQTVGISDGDTYYDFKLSDVKKAFGWKDRNFGGGFDDGASWNSNPHVTGKNSDTGKKAEFSAQIHDLDQITMCVGSDRSDFVFVDLNLDDFLKLIKYVAGADLKVSTVRNYFANE